MKVNLKPNPSEPGWYILDYRPDGAKGKRVREHVEGYAAALALKASLEGQPTGTLHPTFNDICGEYLAWCEENLRPSTYSEYKTRLVRHILPTIGHLRVKDLSQTVLDSYLRGRTKSTRLNDFSKIMSMVDWMVKRNYASKLTWEPERPAYRPKLKRLPEDIDEVLTVLICLRKDWIRTACLLMLLNGLRWIETRLLRWENYRGGTITLEHTKTDDPQTIAIPAPCLSWFEEHRKESGYVFATGRRDSPPSRIKRQLDQACREAGVRLTPHMFRHLSATVLYDQAEDIYAVQHHLRHKRTATTENYTRYSVVKRQRAVDTLVHAFRLDKKKEEESSIEYYI